MWNVVLLARRADTSYVTGVLPASHLSPHSSPSSLFHVVLGIYAGRRCTKKSTYNTFKNWSRSLLFLCVFLFDPAIFGNPCRGKFCTVWASSSENSSYDTDCHCITGYTEPCTPSSTHTQLSCRTESILASSLSPECLTCGLFIGNDSTSECI